jgi:hypothetical protein
MKMTMSIWSTTWQSLGSKYGYWWAAYGSVRNCSLTGGWAAAAGAPVAVEIFSMTFWILWLRSLISSSARDGMNALEKRQKI